MDVVKVIGLRGGQRQMEAEEETPEGNEERVQQTPEGRFKGH